MADRDPDIRLGAHTDRAEDYVARGGYETVEEVLAEAMDALDRQERGEHNRFTALVREAIASPGRFLPMDEAFAELDERKRLRRGE